MKTSPEWLSVLTVSHTGYYIAAPQTYRCARMIGLFAEYPRFEKRRVHVGSSMEISVLNKGVPFDVNSIK